MNNAFDAKAEAGKIAKLAQDTLNNANRDLTGDKARESEDSLAKELASVWSDPQKALPVAEELHKITNGWSFLPNFELHLENKPGEGWTFGSHMVIETSGLCPTRGSMEAERVGNQLKISTYGGAHSSITSIAELPEKHT